MLWRYMKSAMINFKFHVIARIDDTAQVLIDHICVHDLFPKCWKTKLKWSKNVGGILLWDLWTRHTVCW